MKMFEYRLRLLFGNKPTRKSATAVVNKHWFPLKRNHPDSLTVIWMSNPTAYWCDGRGHAITFELDDAVGIYLTVNHGSEPWVELAGFSDENA